MISVELAEKLYANLVDPEGQSYERWCRNYPLVRELGIALDTRTFEDEKRVREILDDDVTVRPVS